jgi:hypothetical protein
MKSILYVWFLLGYIDKKSIIHWSDKQILLYEDNSIYIELSLSINKSDSEILSLLSMINEAELDYICIRKYYFGLFWKLLENKIVKWDKIQEEVLKLYFNCLINFKYDYVSFKGNEDVNIFSLLQNDFNLRKEGYSGIVDMPNGLEFLSFYKDTQIEYNELIFKLPFKLEFIHQR